MVGMERRAFLHYLTGLAAWCYLPVSLATKEKPGLVSVNGNLPPPERISKVISAGPPADILLLALAPEKLLGLSSFDLQGERGSLFPTQFRQLPQLGRLAGRGSTLPLEKLVALAPDVIIDVGNVDTTYLANAQRVSQQTKIPYVLLDGTLSETPQMLRHCGALIGAEAKAETLAQFAEQMLERNRLFRQHHSSTLRRVYMSRGADGLETALAGAIHSEVPELVGLANVATYPDMTNIARVSMEQLLIWDPDIILTQDRQFYQQVYQLPLWQHITAVKNRRVLLVPWQPFGWLDAPPSINRLLGLRWLQEQLQPEDPQGLRDHVRRFYQLFYHITLDDRSLATVLGSA